MSRCGTRAARPTCSRDPKGELGLSKLAYGFLGGIMHNAEALCSIFNPTVNSYKRINAPRTTSGATWSPNTITYTGNNRTHMVRIPDAGRFELRLADGATNPYLLQAGILAAGLDGIDNKRDPGRAPRHQHVYRGPQGEGRRASCRSTCSMRSASPTRARRCAATSATALLKLYAR